MKQKQAETLVEVYDFVSKAVRADCGEWFVVAYDVDGSEVQFSELNWFNEWIGIDGLVL